MPLMHKEVYDAFLAAGVSEAQAASAATAIASYDNRLSTLEHKLDRLAIEVRIYSGILGALILGLFWQVLRISGK